MTEKSNWLPSILLGYKDDSSIRSKEKSNNLSYFIEGTYGQVEYSNYQGTLTHNHNYYKLQGELLYPVVSNLYLGLGYRYLYDYLSDANSYNAYDRKNELLYVPIGYVLNNTDGSSAKFQFNYLIEGTQVSYLSQMYGANSGSADLKNKQKDGYGLDFSYTPKVGTWELFAKYWNIDDSTTNSSTGSRLIWTGKEPKNQTYEIGFRLAF